MIVTVSVRMRSRTEAVRREKKIERFRGRTEASPWAWELSKSETEIREAWESENNGMREGGRGQYGKSAGDKICGPRRENFLLGFSHSLVFLSCQTMENSHFLSYDFHLSKFTPTKHSITNARTRRWGQWGLFLSPRGRIIVSHVFIYFLFLFFYRTCSFTFK